MVVAYIYFTGSELNVDIFEANPGIMLYLIFSFRYNWHLLNTWCLPLQPVTNFIELSLWYFLNLTKYCERNLIPIDTNANKATLT